MLVVLFNKLGAIPSSVLLECLEKKLIYFPYCFGLFCRDVYDVDISLSYPINSSFFNCKLVILKFIVSELPGGEDGIRKSK